MRIKPTQKLRRSSARKASRPRIANRIRATATSFAVSAASLIGVNFAAAPTAGAVAAPPPNQITTIAGGGAPVPRDITPANLSTMPNGMATDAAGNTYFTDTFSNVVRKLSADHHTVSIVAGTGDDGSLGDGGPATAAQFNQPAGVAVDATGNLYIADTNNNRIRKVDVGGYITTIAGGGTNGLGDGGPATAAQLGEVEDVAVDAAGNVYIADLYDYRVRKVDTSGVITTIAGTGDYGTLGDGGPATDAHLSDLQGVAVDAAGNVYIAQTAGETYDSDYTNDDRVRSSSCSDDSGARR